MILVLALAALILWCIRLVLDREYSDWAPRAAARLVHLASALTPAETRGRWRAEWLAELEVLNSRQPGPTGLAWALTLPFAGAAMGLAHSKGRLGARMNPAWVAGLFLSSAITGITVVILSGFGEFGAVALVVTFVSAVMFTLCRYTLTGVGDFVNAPASGFGVLVTAVILDWGPTRAAVAGLGALGVMVVYGMVVSWVERVFTAPIAAHVPNAVFLACTAARRGGELHERATAFVSTAGTALALVAVGLLAAAIAVRRWGLSRRVIVWSFLLSGSAYGLVRALPFDSAWSVVWMCGMPGVSLLIGWVASESLVEARPRWLTSPRHVVQ